LILSAGAAEAAILFTALAAHAGEVSSEATGLLLVLVFVAGTVLAALAVFEPWLGLLAWLVVMPGLNASRLGITIAGLFVTHATLIIACLALGTILATRSRARGAARVPVKVILLAAAASVLAMVSGLNAPDSGLGFTIALHGVVEPAILAVLVFALVDGPRRVAALALAMTVSVTIATAYNMERLLRLTFVLATAQIDRTGFARFTYYNVGIYGDMLVMVLPLAIGVFLYARARLAQRPVRLVIVWMIALLVAGLYLTFTKGPWIAALIVIPGLLAMSVASWRARAGIVLAAALLATLVVPYPLYLIRAIAPALSNRALAVVTTLQGGNRANSWDPETAEGEVSITERLLATRAALAMAIDHPVLGVGPGNFANAYARQYRPPGATRLLQSAHDMLPDVAGEFGFPLATLFTALFIAAGLTALRLSRRAPPGIRPLARAFGAGLAGFLIVSFTFGVDLYRPWRVMNSDVLFAALLLAGIGTLARAAASARPLEAAPE
jgi:O-antigen ligase